MYVGDAGNHRILSYDSPLPLTVSSAKTARKCQQAIVKASAAYFQATASTRRKCEDGKIGGKIAACPDAKTTTALAKLESKLTGAITKACCGKDKQCTGSGDDQPLVDIGWNVGGCSTFVHGGCSNRIADAADIATCLTCLADATVGDVLGLSYGSLLPSDPKTQKALNGCQRAIGKSATTFAAVESKTLAKCWDTSARAKPRVPTAPMPAASRRSRRRGRKNVGALRLPTSARPNAFATGAANAGAVVEPVF